MDNKNQKNIQDECDHGVKFDAEVAKNLSAMEVRRLFPRFSGKCEKCGYEGAYYASYEHYLSGDW